MKQFLGSTHMCSNEKVKKTVKDFFNGLAADFYNAGRNLSHDMTSA
jgi:hypothetical protein